MTKESFNKEIKVAGEQSRRLRAAKFISKVGLAAACVVPTADLALSDAVGAKIYNEVNEHVQMDNKKLERSAEFGLNAGIIMAETMGLGMALARTKRLRGVFGEFDEYLEERHEKMSPKRKLISKIANAPYVGMEKIGEKFEKAGEKLSNRKSKTSRVLGNLAVDAAKINTLGSTTVVLQETMAGKPPGWRRNAEIGGIITATWLGAAEGIRQLYRSVEAFQPPMAAVGRAFETLTSMDVVHPWNTPVGSIAISSVAMGLAITGWRISEFHEQREELLNVTTTDIINVDNVLNQQTN